MIPPTPAEAVRLYRAFSADAHCAGWHGRPERDPDTMEEFRAWLRGRDARPPPLTDYEESAVEALQAVIVDAWSG